MKSNAITLKLKSLLAVICALATTSVAIAQLESGNVHTLVQRRVVNTVKVVGDWTWFTVSGALYRKHVNSATAELWYRAQRGDNGVKLFDGQFLEASKLASHEVIAKKYATLSGGVLAMRLAPDGVLWFSNGRGTESSYDRSGWSYTWTDRGMGTGPRFGEHVTTWSPASPFADEELWPTTALYTNDALRSQPSSAHRVIDQLFSSIPEHARPHPITREQTPAAVYYLDVHANGTVYIATDDGVHIFRPVDAPTGPLNETTVQTGAPLRAADPYPNPASETVTFAIANATSETMMSVDIRDLIGRTRMQGIVGAATSTRIDVTGLEEGVYVAVINSNGSTAMTRFTVRR